MSVVIVQVGQCGNQLGGALLDKLHGEAVSSSSSSFTKCCFSRFFYSSTSGLSTIWHGTHNTHPLHF